MLKNSFSTRLPQIKAKLENWWEFGDQEFPCLLITLPPENPHLVPDTDDLEKWWKDTDFIIDRQMKLMANQRYYGQAVPFHYIDCSSSAMSGVLGARMQLVNKDTMWAYPCFGSVEQVAEMAFTRDTFWYRQARTLTERSASLAKDNHFVSLFAMEGITDILAGLYGTENYLVDLLLKPEAVKHASEHVKRIWIELFHEFQQILNQTGNYGQIGWAGIWAPGTHFPLQEDFSYMISNAMYKEFVLPHVIDMINVMEYPLYHLDGIGAIPHLQSLLAIPHLKAIQWVPGAGKERLQDWYELIKLILDGKKSVQVFAEADEVDDLVKNVGARGLLITVQNASQEDAERLVERYNGD
jgi:hypothetical protein